jgi:predicted nuclease of restriction endonuclease-like RecB superfamily
MLPTELLINRYRGETIIPKRLPLNSHHLGLAHGAIACFKTHRGKTQGQLKEALKLWEGDSPDYRLKRGFAHILSNSFSEFTIVSPIDPPQLRERVFKAANQTQTLPEHRHSTLERIAIALSAELGQEVTVTDIEQGLYADLQENKILSEFTEPTPEEVIHRYNLAQVQGIFYKASHLLIQAFRNDPGEYKNLFRFLKLFQLMTYIEGDADTGFTITIDGPTSLFKPSTRYGLAIAKLIPALLHVSKWSLEAILTHKDSYSGQVKERRFTLKDDCGLVSHYSPGKVYDSMLEQSFVKRWAKLNTDWQLEREVNLIPIPGSVMIPDFRLVHPDGRLFILEIVGYWRPDYLRKKFYQVQQANLNNLILLVSERLNLDKSGVKIDQVPAYIVWFKDKIDPKSVLSVINDQ